MDQTWASCEQVALCSPRGWLPGDGTASTFGLRLESPLWESERDQQNYLNSSFRTRRGRLGEASSIQRGNCSQAGLLSLKKVRLGEWASAYGSEGLSV